jgi:putative cardiolipin synthase
MTSTTSRMETEPHHEHHRAVPPGEGTEPDRLIGEAEAGHPGQSGFRLVSHGPEALALRAHSALLAGRSLDVQTYIWHADLTGRYLAHRILEAADRGVRVRLLVDDMDARAKTQGFAALDAHPRIQVRMFNPFESRSGVVSKLLEMVGRFPRLNRRMHNKTWIADNRLAIVGGRNLGDEYFGGDDEVNFFDLDFAMVGPVVREASDSFDRYWNASVVRSMRELAPDRVNEDELRRVREILDGAVEEAEASPFVADVRGDDAVKRLVAGDWHMEWTDSWRFVSDDPEKVTRDGQHDEASRVIGVLRDAVEGARESLVVISPYFVPGQLGTEVLLQVVRGGCGVEVLTNSLVANDVAAVHGGYTRYRTPLLDGGVSLWELKPMAGRRVTSRVLTTSRACLHTKALAVDGEALFVGSYNLDPRSRFLNCEQGIMARNAPLAEQLESIFRQQTSGSHAWRVSLGPAGRLGWTDGDNTYESEPQAPFSRKLQAWLARVLPVEAQL